MIAERRYSARHPIDLKVQVIYGRRRFNGARARNLSNQGMLLTLPKVTLPHGTPVELEFSCLGRDWLVEAIVVHGRGHQVGVMFREPQPALYQGLLHGQVPSSKGQPSAEPVPDSERPRPLLARH